MNKYTLISPPNFASRMGLSLKLIDVPQLISPYVGPRTEEFLICISDALGIGEYHGMRASAVGKWFCHSVWANNACCRFLFSKMKIHKLLKRFMWAVLKLTGCRIHINTPWLAIGFYKVEKK